MNKIKIFFLVQCLFFGYTGLSNTFDVNTEKKIISIQEQIKSIYPHILDCTVSIGTGCSGVIVSEDGYVLTASHVVVGFIEDGEKITVKLRDGIEREVECFGRSMQDDFALLKLKEDRKWPYAKIGSSGKLLSNEVCVMMGHSTGYQQDRPAVLRTGFVRGYTNTGFLRTSCTMMPGDSGGPLFNLKGELIGINSYCWELEYENYFSPSDRIMKNWDRIKDGEKFNLFHSNYMVKSIKRAKISDSPYVLSKSYHDLSKTIEDKGQEKSSIVYPIYLLDDDDQLLIHATQITKNGILVSKSSLIKETAVRCKLKDGTFVRAEVIGRSDKNDLVFLHSEEISSIQRLKMGKTEIGDFVGLLNENNKVEQSGIVGVGVRNVAVRFAGMFGMEMDGLRVNKVHGNSNSFMAGIKDGDELISINSNVFYTVEDYKLFMSNTCPSQYVDVKLRRNNEEVETTVLLGPFSPKQHPGYKVKVSGKKEGFAQAFTFDIAIKPQDCGAPLLNLNGEVVGISIARSTRTCAYAIPIKEVLNDYKSIESE